MARSLLTMRTQADRDRACAWIKNGPVGMRVEFREAKRSTEQNDLMWEMLTDISKQKTNHGQKYTPDIWKVLFMSAFGHEVTFIPALEGHTGVIPMGLSSSELSKREMTELIDFIMAWGAEHGVQFTIEKKRAA